MKTLKSEGWSKTIQEPNRAMEDAQRGVPWDSIKVSYLGRKKDGRSFSVRSISS